MKKLGSLMQVNVMDLAVIVPGNIGEEGTDVGGIGGLDIGNAGNHRPPFSELVCIKCTDPPWSQNPKWKVVGISMMHCFHGMQLLKAMLAPVLGKLLQTIETWTEPALKLFSGLIWRHIGSLSHDDWFATGESTSPCSQCHVFGEV